PFFIVGALGTRLVQVLAVGSPERRGGELDLTARAREGLHVLHAALPVAALAEDDGSLVVLQTGRHDFAAAGAAVVDHADHREVEIAAFPGAAVGLLLADAWLDRDDQTIVDEKVGDLNGRGQHATRVVAKIE